MTNLIIAKTYVFKNRPVTIFPPLPDKSPSVLGFLLNVNGDEMRNNTNLELRVGLYYTLWPER